MRNKLLIAMAFIGLTTTIGFNNCGRSSGHSSYVSTDAGNSDVTPTDADPQEEPQFEEKLLTGDQILASFSDITGVSPNQNRVANEYRTKSTLYADNFNLSSITSPMMIGITNLAGEFCGQMVTLESTKVSNERRFFKGLDFTARIDTLSDANFQLMIQTMSQQIWMRDLTEEEYTFFEIARQEFKSELRAPADSRERSRDFAIFICTAFLSSYETITF